MQVDHVRCSHLQRVVVVEHQRLANKHVADAHIELVGCYLPNTHISACGQEAHEQIKRRSSIMSLSIGRSFILTGP